MLKKLNLKSPQFNLSNQLESSMLNDDTLPKIDIKSKFEKLLSGFHKSEIGDPIEAFNEQHLSRYEENVNYGILSLLEGTWLSHLSHNDILLNKHTININEANNGQQKLNSRPYLISSGIHTTIMPSPGTNSETIPGKYSFECDQYIEKLTFTKVNGGVRNRGGVNEQFCGAYKYDQVIKKINLFATDNTENLENKKTYEYFPKGNFTFGNLEVKGIHEENGMYLWLSDVYNHAASKSSISTDRGMKPIPPLFEDGSINPLYAAYKREGLIEVDEMGNDKLCYPTHTWAVLENNELSTHIYDDGSAYHLVDTLSEEDKKRIIYIIPAKELNEGDGIKGPHYLPDYTLSRSGVIPHGSTITLLGNIKNYGGKLFNNKAPDFMEGQHIWNYKHLAISPTMGRAGAPRDFNAASDELKEQFDIDKGMPAWRLDTFTALDQQDPGGNKVYAKEIVSHPLYPYAVRPDLRLRDSIVEVANKEKIIYTAKIEMFTKNETGTQGGILNIPFVNKYVPTIDMTMNMWLQVVEINEKVNNVPKYVLQLQYEQVVNFEFHFGDDGGTTRWPHIQVNTLRKESEMTPQEIEAFYSLFNKDKKEDAPPTGCPFHTNK